MRSLLELHCYHYKKGNAFCTCEFYHPFTYSYKGSYSDFSGKKKKKPNLNSCEDNRFQDQKNSYFNKGENINP